jgi:hypothetical protein
VKYRDNMTADELVQFKKELSDLDAAYKSAAEHDAKAMSPDEWEDQTDYVGMGWIDSRGRP